MRLLYSSAEKAIEAIHQVSNFLREMFRVCAVIVTPQTANGVLQITQLNETSFISCSVYSKQSTGAIIKRRGRCNGHGGGENSKSIGYSLAATNITCKLGNDTSKLMLTINK